MRIGLFTTAGGRAVVAPMVVALWRPKQTMTDDGPHIEPEELTPVRMGLARMPPPSVLVDAAHEIWAGWRLASALSLPAATEAQATLAGRLGAVTMPAGTLAEWHLPVCGPVRNWSYVNGRDVDLVEADAQRRYTLSELLTAAKGQQ